MTDHFVEVPKKVLSPAAQAVLKSVQATLPDYMLTDKTAGFFAAAALRALAVRVKGADAIRQDILDIATELEGQR